MTANGVAGQIHGGAACTASQRWHHPGMFTSAPQEQPCERYFGILATVTSSVCNAGSFSLPISACNTRPHISQGSSAFDCQPPCPRARPGICAWTLGMSKSCAAMGRRIADILCCCSLPIDGVHRSCQSPPLGPLCVQGFCLTYKMCKKCSMPGAISRTPLAVCFAHRSTSW